MIFQVNIPMKNNFTIFYSWQSDLRPNRNFIQSCIEKAIKDIVKKQQKIIELEINIDRDTRNQSGSPAIADSIFQKINACDIFICDVTIINKTMINKIFGSRVSPNPNVLIELGYAVNILGWERVICITDTKFSNIEELPFDIRGHRITKIEGTKENRKEKLTAILTKAIESIIIDFENIISAQSKNRNKLHDLNIYNRLNEICNETILHDSISLSVNSLFINKYYLDIWDRFQDFYKLSINNFIDTDLNELMKIFLSDLDDFDTIITKYFHLVDRNDPAYEIYLSKKISGEKISDEEEFDYKQAQKYRPHKEPLSDETWDQANNRIFKLQDELYMQGEKVKSAYRNLVMKIKQKLM